MRSVTLLLNWLTFIFHHVHLLKSYLKYGKDQAFFLMMVAITLIADERSISFELQKKLTRGVNQYSFLSHLVCLASDRLKLTISYSSVVSYKIIKVIHVSGFGQMLMQTSSITKIRKGRQYLKINSFHEKLLRSFYFSS